MNLIPASEASEDDLRYLVRSVSVGKLFYAHTGRNAWWSTWVTQYSRGCFHTSLASAQSFCETQRVQGTVFYIDEIPALIFHAGDRILVAPEINTTKFLSRLDADRLAQITTVLPITTFTFRQVYLLFRPSSLAWQRGYPQRNSMLLHFGAGAQHPEVVNAADALRSYQSRSNGAAYRLGWRQRPFAIDRSVLHELVGIWQ